MQVRLRRHIIFWLVYLLFESYLQYAWVGTTYSKTNDLRRWIMCLEGETMLCLIKIPLCYAILAIPRVNINWPRWVTTALLVPLYFLVAICIYHWLNNGFILPRIYLDPVLKPFPHTLADFISAFPDLLFVVVMVVALKQYSLQQASLEKARLLEKEKLETELKFLRAQINPHFLFNTLNNIYALARKKSDSTPDVVLKLSKLLRFMLYESGNRFISIADELKVLEDYIELEKIRFNQRLKLTIVKSIDDETQKIAPLILLPFVDNAFKHGVSETRFDSFINIRIQLEQGRLQLMVENSKENTEGTDNGGQIGLRNVQRQLELMYPDHQLVILDEPAIFRITLTINLHQYDTH